MRFGILIPFIFALQLLGQPGPPLLSLGDSITEGVQSADANLFTQVNSYSNLIAAQMGVSFPLPLIVSNPFAFIESTDGRFRLQPGVLAANIAASGADSTSILRERSATSIHRETDLVLQPRVGLSQVEVAEQVGSPLIICWIGSNDSLGAILAFDHLDASQMTPVSVFDANYTELIQRLSAAAKKVNGKVIVANVLDVTDMAFLVDANDLRKFLGSDYGFPAGSYSSILTMGLIKTGLAPPSLLQDPNHVLDPQEIKTIQDRVDAYNQIIATRAAQAGVAVVDMHALTKYLAAFPIVIDGRPITFHYLGGAFSLDGVHPSNIGHAVIANAFIFTMNAAFHMNIPLIPFERLIQIYRDDPFVDLDGDLKVRGRPLLGLLETLGPLLGISGDVELGYIHQATPGIDPTLGAAFMKQYMTLMGKGSAASWTQNDAADAMRHVFGVSK